MQYKRTNKAYGRGQMRMLEDGSFATLVGKQIKINRGGPEAKSGKLLALKPDHLVLHSEGEGVIYYQTQHIKSITIHGNLEAPEVAQQNVEEQEPISFIDAPDFTTLLQNLTNSWIQVNRGGPEKYEGILVEANNEYLKVSANNELTIIMTFHVKSVSLAPVRPPVPQDNQMNTNGPLAAQNANDRKKTKKRVLKATKVRLKRNVGLKAKRKIKKPPLK